MPSRPPKLAPRRRWREEFRATRRQRDTGKSGIVDGTIVFILVALAGFAAGFINAVAGGGSFLTF
ncbi:MAG: hypothetical protein L0Y60_14500, partial [Beijerinckiaceae bacterium]|nr:hypothetical protein [Beijerinckiaceae bacterium]